MPDQVHHDGGFFMVREGMAIDITDALEWLAGKAGADAWHESMWPNGGRGYDPTRLARQRCFAIYQQHRRSGAASERDAPGGGDAIHQMRRV